MEIIITTISILLFIGLLSIPILIFKYVLKPNDKLRFFRYLIIGLFISSFLCLIFAWWNHKSTEILLRHFDGYIFNPDSNGFQVNYENVLPENLERVKRLEKSYMGIGWTLKAIFLLVFYSPYLLLIYLIDYLINRIKNRNDPKISSDFGEQNIKNYR